MAKRNTICLYTYQASCWDEGDRSHPLPISPNPDRAAQARYLSKRSSQQTPRYFLHSALSNPKQPSRLARASTQRHTFIFRCTASVCNSTANSGVGALSQFIHLHTLSTLFLELSTTRIVADGNPVKINRLHGLASSCKHFRGQGRADVQLKCQPQPCSGALHLATCVNERTTAVKLPVIPSTWHTISATFFGP